jgi:RNA polymerase sigma-70 factor, ECF subfamily
VPLENEHSELVIAAQRGDAKAIEQVIELYAGHVNGLIYSIVGFRDVAQDLAQETFIKMLHALPHYEFRAPFRTWLFRIAVNQCRDHLRKKRVRSIMTFFDDNTYSYDIPDRDPSPQANLEKQETMDQIMHELAHLPLSLRTVLILRDIQELTYEEIAQTLKWRMGTIKSRLFRARKELALRLSKHMKEEL